MLSYNKSDEAIAALTRVGYTGGNVQDATYRSRRSRGGDRDHV